MESATGSALAGWANFYLVTGTAAAALTGLQFVVQSLIASNVHHLGGDDPVGGTGAFGTPTVVHFTLALLLSALMCVPWSGDGGLRATLVVLGGGALVYGGIVVLRARRQRAYIPVLEDWVWHLVLPPIAYAAVVVAGVLAGAHAEGPPLFVVAAATLLLLCVGIHNAWDTVTYLTLHALRTVRADEAAKSGAAPDSPSRRA